MNQPTAHLTAASTIHPTTTMTPVPSRASTATCFFESTLPPGLIRSTRFASFSCALFCAEIASVLMALKNEGIKDEVVLVGILGKRDKYPLDTLAFAHEVNYGALFHLAYTSGSSSLRTDSGHPEHPAHKPPVVVRDFDQV